MPINGYEDPQLVQSLFIEELTKPTKLSQAINSKEVTELLKKMKEEYGD